MRRRAVAVAVLAVLSAGALAGCGGGSTPEDSGAAIVETVDATTDAGGAPPFAGGTVSPVKPAPELGLVTWDGRPVRTADYRGQAVLVAFVYVNCPDICPLIIDNLVRVKRRLGRDGDRLRIVAVSVDPRGDTPEAVRRFLQRHRATGQVDYLVGSRRELEPVWARWAIGARATKDNPSLIEHSGTIWGVDPQGRRRTFYPASGFDADEIAADMRLLLG